MDSAGVSVMRGNGSDCVPINKTIGFCIYLVTMLSAILCVGFIPFALNGFVFAIRGLMDCAIIAGSGVFAMMIGSLFFE
jgi:hypothetical protein